MCLNIGASVVSQLDFLDASVRAGVVAADTPKIYNNSDTGDESYLVANLTNPRNSTSTGLFDWFEDSAEITLFMTNVMKFLTLGFVFEVIDNMSTAIGVTFPDGLTEGLMGLFGVYYALWILYLFTGRSTSGAT